jgi:hypothetical protein
MKKHLATLAIALVASAIVHAGVQYLAPARADQSERVPPTAGIYTGPAYAALLGNAFRSVSSANKGPTSPANVGGSVVDGLEWLDDSGSLWLKKRYVNGGWATEGAFDPTTSTFVPPIGGGVTTLASAATVDLGSVPQATVTITAGSNVSSFGLTAPTGAIKALRFSGGFIKLVYSSALPAPCGYDLFAAVGDRAVVQHLGSGNWEFLSYFRASGYPALDCAAVGRVEFNAGAAAGDLPNYFPGDGRALPRSLYPQLVAKYTRAQNGTRTSGNATITSVANTAGLGAGMPVEGTGIAAACTIASVTSNSITLNSSACVTASGTSTVTVFVTGYGTGGSSTTIGLPDCRGRTMAGRDRNDPGTFANRLTASWFGADSSIFNKAGGFESHTLLATQIPTITSANAAQAISVDYTVPSSRQFTIAAAIANWTPNVGNGGSINTPTGTGGFSGISSITATGNNAISVTSNNTSGTAHPIVPPTLIAECIVRVVP